MSNVIPPATPYNVGDEYDGYSNTLFAPNEEYSEPMQCPLIGRIPEWIQGSFIRVGAGTNNFFILIY